MLAPVHLKCGATLSVTPWATTGHTMVFPGIEQFLASSNEFSILRSTDPSGLVNGNTRRICILDSLFNPPHLAHYALAKEALRYKYENTDLDREGANPKTQIPLILLLLVKNADKGHTTSVEEISHRLEMMLLMADYLHENLGVHVTVAVTNHAKFVDKSSSVLSYLKLEYSQYVQQLKLTFLVGFDTLLRIFDPKYYVPDKLLDSLNEFMQTTDLFCLTRNDKLVSYQNQVDYVKRMRHGLIAAVPLAWSNSVHLFTFPTKEENERLGAVSSTSIRAAMADNQSDIPVIPTVKDYIQLHHLYH